MPRTSNRTDAKRNRERLLAAATEAFKAAESQVSLEAIAREAGVGIGTLYRNFPTREDLVEAVYLSELDRLLAGAAKLLADGPPDLALRAWMDRFAAWADGKQGMTETLRAMFASGAIVRSEKSRAGRRCSGSRRTRSASTGSTRWSPSPASPFSCTRP